MSRREDIDNAIWSDPDFEGLAPHAKLVYLWSFTNPRCGMAGIYKLAPKLAAFEVGLDADDLAAALEDLTGARFLFHEDGVLWVRTRVRHLRTRTPQIARSVAKDLEALPSSHPLRLRFLEEYGTTQWLVDELSVLAPDGGWEGSACISDRRRTEVFERDEHACLACGTETRLTIDHIVPVSRGGRNDLENLQTLCVTCHARKGMSEVSYLLHTGSGARGSNGVGSSPLGEVERSSTEGPQTLKGKGKGKGIGKGPQGRGAGEGISGFYEIADELGVDRNYVKFYLDTYKRNGQTPTPDVMRQLLAQWAPRAA